MDRHAAGKNMTLPLATTGQHSSKKHADNHKSRGNTVISAGRDQPTRPLARVYRSMIP